MDKFDLEDRDFHKALISFFLPNRELNWRGVPTVEFSNRCQSALESSVEEKGTGRGRSHHLNIWQQEVQKLRTSPLSP